MPRVIGPEGIPQVTDRDQAVRAPQLAVLSVVAHGAGEVEAAVSVARAAIHAVLSLPEEQRLLYSVLIEKALSEAARKALAMEPQSRSSSPKPTAGRTTKAKLRVKPKR